MSDRIDPAVILGLRITFTTEELAQLHEDAVNEQDAVTNRDPWLRLVEVLFIAANPRDTCNCPQCRRSAAASKENANV